MATFHVTWDDGREETVVQSDCATIEQFLNCRCGSGKTPSKVVVVDSEAVTEVPTEKPKAKKSTK